MNATASIAVTPVFVADLLADHLDPRLREWVEAPGVRTCRSTASPSSSGSRANTSHGALRLDAMTQPGVCTTRR
jgi:hypothetical protein